MTVNLGDYHFNYSFKSFFIPKFQVEQKNSYHKLADQKTNVKQTNKKANDY